MARRLLGAWPRRVEAFVPTIGGDDSYGFRLVADGEQMLLQVRRKPGTPIGIVFYERIRAAGVPVADLVACDRCAGPQGQAAAIWRWVEGTPADWVGGDPCPYDEAELGAILRRIHDLSASVDYGLLGDDLRARTWRSHPDLGPTSQPWGGFFDCEAAARRYRDKGYLSAVEAHTLSRLPHRLAGLLDGRPKRLLHMGDIMHHGNLIVGADGCIAAVLDFCESMVGDPRWELAWFNYYFRQYPIDRARFDMDRFQDAYGTRHDPDDDLGWFYLLAILLFEKLLFYEPTSRRGVWAIRTAKRRLNQLG